MRFFLIDRIVRWEVGAAGAERPGGGVAEALKNVALSEDFFDDHFPGRPVMPGVLMLEGMAQLAGLLLEACLQARYGSKNAKALLTVVERTRFRELVRPGDTLVYRAEVLSVNEAGGKAAVTATRDGAPVVDSALVFAFKHVDDPALEEKRRALLTLWQRAD